MKRNGLKSCGRRSNCPPGGNGSWIPWPAKESKRMIEVDKEEKIPALRKLVARYGLLQGYVDQYSLRDQNQMTACGPSARTPKAEAGGEITRIEPAILQGAVRIFDECGGLQATLKRSIALKKESRQQGCRWLIHSSTTLQTARLSEAYFR